MDRKFNSLKRIGRLSNINKSNLETFNPFDRNSIINSPLSLKICKDNSIVINELYHKTFDDVRSIICIQYRINK